MSVSIIAKIKIILLLLVYLTVVPRVAFAYLDPGTGSFFIQMLIAFLAGASFAIKLYWRKLVSFSGRIFSKKQKDKKEND